MRMQCRLGVVGGKMNLVSITFVESDAERWVAISVSISCEYVEFVGFVELLSSSPD